jgi:hypothetical protein
MKVTVITLYRAWLSEYYTGVVTGELSEKQKSKITKDFKLKRNKIDDESDEIYFATVDLNETHKSLKVLVNIDGNFKYKYRKLDR